MLLQQLGIEVLMLLAGYAKVKKVVIFDFDKTLTTRDTFKIWIACVFYFFPHKVILCLNILLMKIYKEPEKLAIT